MGLCEWGEHWEGAVLSLVWVGGCCGPGAGRWLSRWAPCPSPVPAPPPSQQLSPRVFAAFLL